MKRMAGVGTTLTQRHIKASLRTMRPSWRAISGRRTRSASMLITATALGWLKPVQNILVSFGANIIKQTNHSPGSDIAPMANAGVPALGIMQDSRTYFNYHHTAADTLDKIAPQELRENAAAMAVMGYALASLPESLPR